MENTSNKWTGKFNQTFYFPYIVDEPMMAGVRLDEHENLGGSFSSLHEGVQSGIAQNPNLKSYKAQLTTQKF